MKGKGKRGSQKKNNVDDIMNQYNMDVDDDNMDDGFGNYEKQFDEKNFNLPIYDNIDQQFSNFSKAFGGDDLDDPMTSSKKSKGGMSEEDKILQAILGSDAKNINQKKKKNNDMEELQKALKLAEQNQNKKYGNDAEVLKGVLSNANNKQKAKKNDDDLAAILSAADKNLKKKNDDDLAAILSAADKNLKKKNDDDMNLVKSFLTKEEMENPDAPKKNTPPPQQKPPAPEDLYPVQQEKIFHRVKEMKSLTVLEEEMKLCDIIIAYKKKKGFDSTEWETKKETANTQLNSIKDSVESGKMDFEAYKQTITNELAYEQKLLNVFVPKDKTSSKNQLELIKARINKRINIINKEINQEIEGEEEEETKQEPPKNEPQKIEENIPKQTEKIPEKIPEKAPEKVQENVPKKEEQSNQNNEEKIRNYVDLLLQQYLSAKDYFKANDLKEQEKDCVGKCKQIIMAKKQIQDGKSNQVKLNDLPKSIKPEYIYGYSSEERTRKFKEILSELIKQKNDIQEKMKSFTEKLKKLNKKEFLKAKDAAKAKLDSDKSKIEKLNKIIEEIKEKFKDKWVPAPEYSKTEEEDKVEKINKDIPEYTMRIHIGKTDYDKDGVYLNVKLNYGENKTFTKEVQMKSLNDFNESWDWKFEKNDWKYLFRKVIEIEMEKNHWYKFGGSDVKGGVKIDLKNLKDSCELDGNYKLELVSKRTTPSVNVKISLRSPFGEKQYETVNKEVFHVTKIYPAFNPKSANIPGGNSSSSSNQQKQQQNIQKSDIQTKQQIPQQNTQKSVNISQNVQQQKQQETPKQNVQNTKPKNETPNDSNANNNANNVKVDKSMFKPEELEDVDIIDNLNSLKVLEYKLKLLEADIAKISGRTPRELMQKKVKMSCKIKIIQQQMGDGEVSPQDYYQLMTTQLAHDQNLFAYLKGENQIEKAKLVAIRIKLLNEEITELKEYIK